MSEKIDRAPKEIVEELKRFATPLVSDALDRAGIKSQIIGILPVWVGCPRLVGPALTIKSNIRPLAKVPERIHAFPYLEFSRRGDVIIVDNGGRTDLNTWGGLVSHVAKKAGIAGVVSNGGVRDVEDFRELNFPVFARAVIMWTIRGRALGGSAFNIPIEIDGVTINPGDIVMADENGVVIVPKEKAEEVVEIASVLQEMEDRIIDEIEKGIEPDEAFKRHRYDDIFKEKKSRGK